LAKLLLCWFSFVSS